MNRLVRTIRAALRPGSVMGAWVLCALLLGIGAVAARASLTETTPFEVAARQELATLATADEGTQRIVVIGNSRAQNAFAHRPELDQVLVDAGADVAVADLSAAGMQLDLTWPVIDDVFAAKPDVLLVHPGSFPDSGSPAERSLIGRLRVELGLQRELRLGRPVCPEQTDEQLDTAAAFTRVRLENIDYDLADELVDRAAAEGVAVYFVHVPRSAELIAEVGQVVDTFRAEIADRYRDHDAVTIGPIVDEPELASYCDFNHLNRRGQQRYLRAWTPSFLAFLADLRDGT